MMYIKDNNSVTTLLPVSFRIPCLLFILFTVAACTTAPQKQASDYVAGQAEQEISKKDIKIVKIEPVRPKIALTEELLFKLLLAEIAGHRGQMEISVENYLDLARSTRDPKVVERAARISVYARNEVAAEEAATLWAELDPRNADAHQILAVMALRQGNVDKTLEHLQNILKYSDGKLTQKFWMVVNLLGRERNKELVMVIMEKLMTGRENDPDALYAFANIAARIGKLDRSQKLLIQVLEMEPENDNAALSYISILQRQGNVNGAVTWLEKILPDRDTDDFNLRLAYARILTDVKRYDDARRQFELLSVSAPNNTDVLYALGLLYLQGNRLDDSKLYFTRLIAKNDRFYNAKYYLGRIAEERKDFSTASVWYEGVQQGENFFDAQVRFGLLKAKMGDTEAARAHLKTINTTGEKDATILVQAEGELLTNEERFDEAMEVYSKALYKGYNADLLYSRAMLAEKMGRIDILEKDLLRVVTREPNHAQGLNALGYTLADRTDRYQEALEYIERALALKPNDFFILDSMGWVLYRMGRMEKAKEYLRKAMGLRQDPEIAAHLIEVLWVTGDLEEARKISETALQLAPDDSRLLDIIERFAPTPSAD